MLVRLINQISTLMRLFGQSHAFLRPYSDYVRSIFVIFLLVISFSSSSTASTQELIKATIKNNLPIRALSIEANLTQEEINLINQQYSVQVSMEGSEALEYNAIDGSQDKSRLYELTAQKRLYDPEIATSRISLDQEKLILKARYEDQINEVTFKLLNELIALDSMLKKTKIIEKQFSILSEYQRQIKRQLKLGSKSQSEYLESKKDVIEKELELFSFKKNLSIIIHQISILCRCEIKNTPKDLFKELQKVNKTSLHPKIKVLNAKLKSKQLIQADRFNGLYPKISISTSVQNSVQGSKDPQTNAYIGLELNWTIWDGGQLKNLKQMDQYEILLQQNQLDDLKKNLEDEIKKIDLDLKLQTKESALMKKSLQISSNVYKNKVKEHMEGLITLTSLSFLRNNLFRLELERQDLNEQISKNKLLILYKKGSLGAFYKGLSI